MLYSAVPKYTNRNWSSMCGNVSRTSPSVNGRPTPPSPLAPWHDWHEP